MSHFTLKPLSKAAVPSALQKAERYRLLNEPAQAESICRDVLAVDPENHDALHALLLSLTDQFGARADVVREAKALLKQLPTDYERAYFEGVIHERSGLAELDTNRPGSHYTAYEALRLAMTCFERAEALKPAGNDDAILRWNTCARTLMRDASLKPRPEETWDETVD
ncbi:MAG: hypothetical protein IT381_09550 [Deltaproteobacteria bacterium]|nr:hypothetical protein [Deltaproteobacteria bacterium]